MKKVVRIVWRVSCIMLICAFIIASLNTFIPPSSFSYASVFGLAFPYLLVLYMLYISINFFINRRLSVLMLILLPVGYFNTVNTFGFNTAAVWQSTKSDATLRVMTWNVQGFTNNLRKESLQAYTTSREGILQTISDYNPDVFCIQEYRNIENAKRRYPIRKQLDSIGYKFYYCSNDKVTPLAKNKNAFVTEGVAIYSKLPLLDSGRININHNDKNENLIYADVLFNNKRTRVFTAHWQSFYIYVDTAEKYEDENVYEVTYKERKAAQYKIRETEINHETEAGIIRAAIDQSPYPVIYCGDMNITPASYNYRLLRAKTLQDAFLEKGAGIGNTFYKIGPTLRIDVCLPDTAFAVKQCRREARKLSDHYPVIADMQWK